TDSDYVQAVSAFATYLSDMQHAIADLSYVAHLAGQQAIDTFATLPGAGAGRGPAHALTIEDNQISVGNGSNIVVGNNAFVFVPAVPGAYLDWVSGYDAGQVAVAQQVANAIIGAGHATTAAHLAATHPLATWNGNAA